MRSTILFLVLISTQNIFGAAKKAAQQSKAVDVKSKSADKDVPLVLKDTEIWCGLTRLKFVISDGRGADDANLKLTQDEVFEGCSVLPSQESILRATANRLDSVANYMETVLKSNALKQVIATKRATATAYRERADKCAKADHAKFEVGARLANGLRRSNSNGRLVKWIKVQPAVMIVPSMNQTVCGQMVEQERFMPLKKPSWWESFCCCCRKK